MGLDAVEHRQGVFLGRGRETEGDVFQHLHQHAAEAEGHKLAERPIGDRTDDDFGSPQQHLLDLDAFDLGIGLVLLGVGQNGRVIGRDIGRGLDADHHATGFGLVQDVRRDDLMTTGKPIAVAILAASSADCATPSLGTGMP